MRLELLYNPRLLCERLAHFSIEKRRLAKLRRTVAESLTTAHINSMELLELLRPNKPRVVYDIGANIGTWTLLSKAIFPEIEVHAFEPLKKHQSQFLANTLQLNNVHLHSVALGASAGTASVKITDFSDASSLLELTAEGKSRWHLSKVSEEIVDVETLDSWARENRIPLPDLVKLDVQGYELEVIKGASKCLEHAKAVITEVSFREFYQNQCLFHNLVACLAEKGFTLFAFGNDISAGTHLSQADALFTSQKIHG